MGSIRRKLLFTLIFTELLAGIVAAWASFYTAQSQFDQFLDSELKQMATALAKRGNIPPSSLTLVGSNPEHRILVQVYESGSNSLFLSAKTSPFPILERGLPASITAIWGRCSTSSCSALTCVRPIWMWWLSPGGPACWAACW